MNRIKGILVAGALTGLILITIIVLSIRNADTANEPALSPVVTNQDQPAASLTGEKAVKAWQTYSSGLENTVRILQERDSQYRAQLEAANTTIVQLQDQINRAGRSVAFGGHEEYEEHEGFDIDD